MKQPAMLHGKDAAKNSEQAAKEAFSGNSLGVQAYLLSRLIQKTLMIN